MIKFLAFLIKKFLNLLDSLITFKNRLSSSHNFYPQKYSGIKKSYFLETTKNFKERGYKTSAFVTSKNAKIGPWPINEGLCTLEEHRNLPIYLQTKHLFSTGIIDSVIIGDSFASEEEMKAMSLVNKEKISLNIKLEKNLSKEELDIIYFDNHFRRGDINEYTIRSTQTRVFYKDYKIPPKNKKNLNQMPGEIYINNDKYLNYKGELHIILKEMPFDSKRNLVGKIINEEMILLESINSFKKFDLKKHQ